ncbi:DinB family protein [Nocardia transvalensis]|uniref:DinB family protein n=1 Tax=Nocardia transvalensis TaxID=37333 RepID=UPI001C3F30F1|nr:DinB family protein [Nocardia transvalensis]
MDWSHEIADQLDQHWQERLRARLEGLTAAEYVWEPVRDCWTIARRMAHITVHVLAKRAEMYFGGTPVDYDTYLYAGTAAEALDRLDRAYDSWSTGLRASTAADLARPCGPDSGSFAGRPLAAVALHVHREVFHHGAEISLLRDLYPKAGVPSLHRG